MKKPSSDIDYKAVLENMLEGINQVKDDATRGVLRLQLEADCVDIIKNYPNSYQPWEKSQGAEIHEKK